MAERDEAVRTSFAGPSHESNGKPPLGPKEVEFVNSEDQVGSEGSASVDRATLLRRLAIGGGAASPPRATEPCDRDDTKANRRQKWNQTGSM
jgi:hypothetical protein